MIEATQVEINIWEAEHQHRIVSWSKDLENQVITFTLDDVKTGEKIIFKIISSK